MNYPAPQTLVVAAAGFQRSAIVPQKRIRFNANQPEVQRRYRERKKERLTELESRVEDLQAGDAIVYTCPVLGIVVNPLS